MAETIVDSSIIIDFLRGQAAAVEYLDQLSRSGELAAHVVVVAEVLAGARDAREQSAIEQAFQRFRVYAPSEEDCRRSLGLFAQFRLSHGVGWLDALIASTCARLQLPVATLNDKHFTLFRDLRVVRPY